MHLWALLEKAARESAETVAVIDGDVRLTYGQLRDRALRLAGHLAGQGVEAGDRVSVLDVNSHAYLETYFAVAALGAITNPVNHRLSPGEIAGVLSDAGSRLVIVRSALTHLLAPTTDCPPRLVIDDPSPNGYEAALAAAGPFAKPGSAAPGDVAHLYYTSGSTGKPKGVMLTHRNVTTHALGNIAELHLTDGDVWGHFAPLFHLADAWAAFALTWVGGTHVMQRRFEPAEVLATVEREAITATALIPTMVNMLVNDPALRTHRYDRLRLLITSGAPIADELVAAAIEAFGCEYVQAYGLTETCPHLTMSLVKSCLKTLPEAEQMAIRCTTGRPFIGVELRVVGDGGREVAANGREVGEIQVKGDTITPGYWRNPEATAATFRDGWFCTGDLAVLDARGYVTIVDRKKDMIVTGGENVYCAEVENVLYDCPQVLEAAVFGIPDDRWGEAVKAAVVLRPGQAARADEIIAWCHAHLAAYKAPKSIDFLPALPRTGSGKIDKKPLRDPYWAHEAKQV